MSVKKRKNPSGKIVWYYRFDAPGSTRENRSEIREFGFKTQKEAIDAEAARRIEEQKRFEMEKAGAGVTEAVPTTLGKLLQEFIAQHAEQKLAPKTVERYREQAGYLDADLLKMPIEEIKPLHLNREWSRLPKAGGHTRKKKEPRPMAPKTVRNIAGVVSAAFGRAIKWGLVTTNPVTNSEPPVPKKPKGIGLTVAQKDVLIEAASGPWCMSMLLDMAVGLGARRGEVMALRWSDIVGGRAHISRTLSQTKTHGLVFKALKGHEDTEESRMVAIPGETLVKLEEHRKRQDEFRKQYGPDYRADLDLIFANPDGTPLKPDSISATVSALFKRLKMPKPRGGALHLLRHTLASQMLDGGVPLPVVSARLGHSNIRTTAEIYSHAIHGQDDEATRKWEEYQRRNRPAASDGSQKGQVQ